ncbi:MAG: VOC family protein [Hyphomicrobiaceae bacterium]|nr:VOC family protein [Hyphomicrobiaceae bacterium]
MTQKVKTCFWYDTGAEEAAKLYVSLIPNSQITNITRYGEGQRMPAGLAMVVNFTLDGAEFMALNGGPIFKHSEAASLVVQCDDQDEIDRLWSALLIDGGKEQQCGWLKDRYGLPWQIVPKQIATFMTLGSPEQQARVMESMMGMVKIDIATLNSAFDGG